VPAPTAPGIPDVNLGNDSATDSAPIGPVADGFEIE